MTRRFQRSFLLMATLWAAWSQSGCRTRETAAPVWFVARDSSQTGLDFDNFLKPSPSLNTLNYMYYYNGAGIGCGDFNNDGRPDLFFASNQGDNKLYLNSGNLHFRDVTREAGIPEDGGWSTGVSVVDINNDGLLDIYICRVGNFLGLHSRNQLLVCQGIDRNGVPHYRDEAHEYGLDFSGFSTQAVFFDYDGDGDLDMYLLNHSLHQNGTIGQRSMLLDRQAPGSGDRLYRNDGNGHFTDVTAQAGIHSSVLGYGLGICVADVNMDGLPDIYVGNDFHENDYLYINQGNGTFREENTERMMHTSRYTMGVDIADVNNDGYDDVISLDMLSPDPHILRRSLGDDDEDLARLKLQLGYSYQYSRNNLQLNRRNGLFSETGLYSGVAATDWSWAPLWMDFDNDGLKDLFISNGIPKRLNDIDYINFVSNTAVQEKLRTGTLDRNDQQVLDRAPAIRIPNRFFRNEGRLQFRDLTGGIRNDPETFSNGAVYADFDHDGDLDIVVNNINQAAVLYENRTNSADGTSPHPWVDITLAGPATNRNAIGARMVLFCGSEVRTYEKYPVHGFLSSMEIPLHIGLEHTQVDSAYLIWPDNTCQPVKIGPGVREMTLSYHPGLPKFPYEKIIGFRKNPTRPMEDITAMTGLQSKPVENDYEEFNIEPLLPHMLSTEGPALAVGDVNRDGLEDVFIGSARGGKSMVFCQDRDGRFHRVPEPAIDNDSLYEDIDACFTDVNGDGAVDLVVVSGGSQSPATDPHLMPRVYLNNGKGVFTRLQDAFGGLYVNASCVAACDFNGDGKTDLFIGGRSVPFDYGSTPRSYLLQNDGTGHFLDVTDRYASGLSHVGMVTGATWCDLNGDGMSDLVVTLEWGGIDAFIRHRRGLVKEEVTGQKGWWNFVLPVDLNGDGKTDLVAGNLGLNTKLQASQQQPVRMYCNDFYHTGNQEQILTYYLRDTEIPFAGLSQLASQMPLLRKKYPDATDFANASLDAIFTKDQLDSATVLAADDFHNSILINRGNGNFDARPMPWMAQLSCYRDAVVVDANHDSLPDILLVGNFYENPQALGRSDADFGTILLNRGGGQFEAVSINGLAIRGQVRHIRSIRIGGQPAFILARNNDSTMVIRFKP